MTDTRPRYVPGEGPMPAKCMLIGEGPGEEENKQGRPFVGKSGQLLNMLLSQSGLNRDDIYITNLVKFQVPGNADPTAADIKRDRKELQVEFQSVKPAYIGLLGRNSARHFLGDIDLEWAHGLAFKKRGICWMPCYHPAFGLHAPEALPLVAADIRRFALMAKGKIPPDAHRDAFPKPRYVLIKKSHYPMWMAPELPIYIDTEGSADKPWGLSFTQRNGSAGVILADNVPALRAFRGGLKMYKPLVVLHNAMHDIPVLRAMGIEFDNFRDTMVRAHLLGTEPQGLKPLARRHAAMVMDSYDDILSGARKKISIDYLKGALQWLNKHCPEESKTSSSRRKKRSTTMPAGKSSAKIFQPKPHGLSTPLARSLSQRLMMSR